jgi:hypothetical protein
MYPLLYTPRFCPVVQARQNPEAACPVSAPLRFLWWDRHCLADLQKTILLLSCHMKRWLAKNSRKPQGKAVFSHHATVLAEVLRVPVRKANPLCVLQ